MTKEELKEKIDDIIWNHSKKEQTNEIISIVEEYTEKIKEERDKWKETASKHQ